MTLRDLNDHYGNLIGGGLTLLAGVLAYLAGLKQAAVAIAQNKELHRTEQRRRTSDNLTANRVLDGVLALVKDDLDREISFVGTSLPLSDTVKGEGAIIEPEAAALTRQRIKAPDLALIWPHLGQKQSEWINNFLCLHRDIVFSHGITKEAFQLTPNRLLDEYRAKLKVVEWLRNEISETDRILYEVLQSDPPTRRRAA